MQLWLLNRLALSPFLSSFISCSCLLPRAALLPVSSSHLYVCVYVRDYVSEQIWGECWIASVIWWFTNAYISTILTVTVFWDLSLGNHSRFSSASQCWWNTYLQNCRKSAFLEAGAPAGMLEPSCMYQQSDRDLSKQVSLAWGLNGAKWGGSTGKR